MRTHLDRYPTAIQSVKNVWSKYAADEWRTFGPIHSMMKAADLIGLRVTTDMKFMTSEGFAFAPLTDDIQKILLLTKRQTLWKATQHKRSDMSELPSIKLDHRINKLLNRMDPLRRAAVDQALFGTVTTQAELAKQHKVSPACTHCGDQTAASSPEETLEHRYWACPKWNPFRKNYPDLVAAEPHLSPEARKFGLLQEPKQVLQYMKSLDRIKIDDYKSRDPKEGTYGTYATDGSAFFSSCPRWRHCTWAAVLDLYKWPEAGLLPGLTQTINRADLTAALCAMSTKFDVVIFTDSMHVVRSCERIKRFHKRKCAEHSSASRLTYATKRNCPNHDLWHLVDIIKVRGNRVRIYKVASTHSFKDVDEEAERSTAEAARRIGNLAADDAAEQCHAARHRWGGFDPEDIKTWCDQDQEDLASHSKVIDYMAAFGLHVLGATTETLGKTSPHGAGYCPGKHTTPGHCAPRKVPGDFPAPLGPHRAMRHITAADRPTVRVLFWQCFTTK